MVHFLIAYAMINMITGLFVIVNVSSLYDSKTDESQKSICDSCRHLLLKKYKKGRITYDCAKFYKKYHKAPLICSNYKEKTIKAVEGNWKNTMNKYINVDKAIALYCQCRCGIHFNRCEKMCNTPLMLDHLAKQDDAVEIVRCKDCKHYKTTCTSESCYDEWFCANGTRKED